MKKHEKLGTISIEIARDPSDAGDLGRFFVENVDPSYISHGELQQGRALSPDAWSPDIERLVSQEYERVIKGTGKDAQEYIILAKEGNLLVGYAFVEAHVEDGFGVIPDMITRRDKRGSGIGGKLLDWVDNDLKARGIKRVFLESGLANEKAHEFFEKHQYRVVSKVFMKEI
jgi:N-acetylglutamate synthase-like GNAT family acetyltransferase